MQRPHILSLLLLAAASVAAADETPASAPAADAPTASASATTQSHAATSQGAKKQRAAELASNAKAAGEETADAAAAAGEAAKPGSDVKMSGMSILGNEDAPKSLVLVPWKSSQLGDMPSVSRLLDSATQPVDKDVFMRELSYYEFKTGSK